MATKKIRKSRNRRRNKRRFKAYFARTAVLILGLAAVCAVIFLCVKLFGVIKDALPFGDDSTAVEEDISNAHNIISLNKDGSLTETSVEDFDTSEYDPEALTEMVNSTIAEYNSSAGESIELKTLDIKDGIARAVIYYKTPEDYAAYNEKVLQIGDASELDITGITLADDENTVLTKDDMDKVKGNYVMLNDDTVITLPKTIQYVSRNVTKTGKKTAEVKKAGINSVIIYK
ncbi:MAG: hypothetical protein K5668_05695 [Lachnospiraceae bacterium]|nr:hypothetical protein [Lachnospiraceae bacterium]